MSSHAWLWIHFWAKVQHQTIKIRKVGAIIFNYYVVEDLHSAQDIVHSFIRAWASCRCFLIIPKIRLLETYYATAYKIWTYIYINTLCIYRRIYKIRGRWVVCLHLLSMSVSFVFIIYFSQFYLCELFTSFQRVISLNFHRVKTKTYERDNGLLQNTNKNSDIRFCQGHKHKGNYWIQQFCVVVELKNDQKHTSIYIFYQRINKSVCAGASPSVVIASGQPAVSDTDGVLKPGGGTAGERVSLLTFIQSLILTTLWSFQLSVKMMVEMEELEPWVQVLPV